MPKDAGNTGRESNPHFDGRREGIIHDATGVQIGMQTSANPLKRPFHLETKDETMKKFRDATKGNPEG